MNLFAVHLNKMLLQHLIGALLILERNKTKSFIFESCVFNDDDIKKNVLFIEKKISKKPNKKTKKKTNKKID